MKRCSRFVLPIFAGALVLGGVAVPSSSASSSDLSAFEELRVEVRDEGDCKAVASAGGVDALCANGGGGVTVIALRDQPRGLACPSGGRAVSWGSDVNGDGILEPSELEGSTYLCRHAGTRRAREAHETRALVAKTALDVRDGHCPAGGTLVQSGLDRDGDGVLSAGEVDRATFACNRFGGPALEAVVDVADEPPGAACAHGGKRIGVGHEGEAARISWACNAR